MNERVSGKQREEGVVEGEGGGVRGGGASWTEVLISTKAR